MRILHKDFTKAKQVILQQFKEFTLDTVKVPEQFVEHPEEYKEFAVRSAIIGEISKLEWMVFEAK